MTVSRSCVLLLSALVLTACTSTKFKAYEGRDNVYEGVGGTRESVDGIDWWENGDPPRKYKVLGIIDDDRGDAIIPMAMMKSDIASKARQAGADGVILLSEESQVRGAYTTGFSSANTRGTATPYSFNASTNSYGSSTTTVKRRKVSRFAVVKYLD